jgi:hypothetical protein
MHNENTDPEIKPPNCCSDFCKLLPGNVIEFAPHGEQGKTYQIRLVDIDTLPKLEDYIRTLDLPKDLPPETITDLMGFHYFVCNVIVQSQIASMLGMSYKYGQPHSINRFRHGNVFTVAVPASWQRKAMPGILSLFAPAGIAVLSGSAYENHDGALTDFARDRFAAIRQIALFRSFTQVGDETHYTANGLNIIRREYEGTFPGNCRPSYYVVNCIELVGGIFVSLTITTARKEFTKNRKLYEDIIASVERAA